MVAKVNFEVLGYLQTLNPLNIQPVVVVRGLKRQQVAALTNLVGCFFSCSLASFFSPLALNDLAGPSAGPLARKTYSIPFHSNFEDIRLMSVRLIPRLRLSTNILSFINHSR